MIVNNWLFIQTNLWAMVSTVQPANASWGKIWGKRRKYLFLQRFLAFQPSIYLAFVWINTLLNVIRDLVNVDTKRSYLCLTQTFIVLWIAWSVSTSTDAVASSRRRILFLGVYCTYDLMLHFNVNGRWLRQKRRQNAREVVYHYEKGAIPPQKRPGQANQLFLPNWEVLSFCFHVHH